MKTTKLVFAVIALALVAGCGQEMAQEKAVNYKPFVESSFELDGCKFNYIRLGSNYGGFWVAKCKSNENVSLEYKTTSGSSTISHNTITQMERAPKQATQEATSNNGSTAINVNGKSGIVISVDGKVVKVEGAE